MAIAENRLFLPLLSYETYMAEEEIFSRYEIIDGKRIFMPGATELHQDIVLTIGSLLKIFSIAHGGKAVIAPRDVLITRNPLKTRQPDVMLFSSHRHSLNGDRNSKAPYAVAPELVVEILSDSDRTSVLNAKLVDYQKVEVSECWIVDLEEKTVEVLELNKIEVTSFRIFTLGEDVQSLAFPDLKVNVEEIFS